MSLKLSYSGDLECGCHSGWVGRGFFEDVIHVGDNEIHKDDFAELVMYFMTNTDLEVSDVRVKLADRISKLRQTEGYNDGNFRLADPS